MDYGNGRLRFPLQTRCSPIRMGLAAPSHFQTSARFVWEAPIHKRTQGSEEERVVRMKRLLRPICFCCFTRFRVAKTMITAHPYNTWPLHVKFFVSTSKKAWDQANVSQPFPTGMTSAEEYEGVDGKSGLPGSGRVGPIDVTDGKKKFIPSLV